ncbi:hypothetical protein R80B4_01328 [Fibrobacteres bacterium R8-0-B4]
MKRVCLDNCCNSRLFDDDTQPKVKAQADAIRRIICNQKKGDYVIVGSFAAEIEIAQIPDDEKRREAEKLYKEAIVGGTVEVSAQIMARAQKLESMGLGKMDAAHLAAAEAAEAEYLITTDEKFIRRCARNNLTAVNVINPIDFERR